MLINKIYFVLKSFGSEDWKEFGKFVESPYFVSGEINFRLYKKIRKYFIDKRRKKTSEESFSSFFLNIEELKICSKQTAHNRISSFYKLMKKYFQFREINPNTLYINMQGEYLTRNLINDFADNLEAKEHKVYREYLQSGESEFLQTLYSQKFVYLMRKNDNVGAFNAHRDQMKFFAAGFLENLFYHNLKNYFSRFYENKEYQNYGLFLLENLNLKNIVDEIAADESGVFNRALIRYYLMKMYSMAEGIKYLKELENIFFRNENQFPLGFRLSVYNYIEAYYTNEINKGNTGYVYPLFRLLKQREEHNLMIDNFSGIFSLNIFTNFITAGLKVRELDIVNKFIEKYYTKLPEEIRMDEYYLNKSRLHFQKKEYNQALAYLNKSNITYYDKYHFMQSRLKLQIFYELGMTDEAYGETDNFKHRIRNSKITPTEAKNFALDYIGIFLKLLKLKSGHDAGDASHVLKGISENWNPMSREWIAEKIEELKNIAVK